MSITGQTIADAQSTAASLPLAIDLSSQFIADCFKVWVLHWDAYLLRKLQSDIGTIQTHDAKDILQDVYVALFSEASDRSGSPFVKLLYPLASHFGDHKMIAETSCRTAAFARVVARNQFLKVKRVQRSQRRVFSVIAPRFTFGAGLCSVDTGSVWSAAQLELLEQALRHLDPEDSDFLRQYYARLHSRSPRHDRSHGETLSRLASSHWERAARLRNKLRALMDKVEPNSEGREDHSHARQSTG